MSTLRTIGWLGCHAWLALSCGVQSTVFAQAPGTVDRSFNPGSSLQGEVLAILPLPDGRVYVGGAFRVLGGVFRSQLARLKPDGSVDASFSVASGFDNLVTTSTGTRTTGGWVNSLGVRGDGKLLVAGFFNRVDGIARNGFALLNSDGKVDAGFDPAAHCAGGRITGFTLLPGDQVLIRGSFTNVWDMPRAGLARLQADGTLDSTFDASATLQGQGPRTVAPQPDGKLLVAGYYPSFNGLFRLNPNGSLDAGFGPQTGANSSIDSLAVQPDGRIVVTGSLTSVGLPNPSLARLEEDGSLDPSFLPTQTPARVAYVSRLVIASDGRLLVSASVVVGGTFSGSGLVRLLADGTVDTAFGVNGCVEASPLRAFGIRPDGQILLGGGFQTVRGTRRVGLAQVNEGGSLDPGFNAVTGIDSYVYEVTPLTNGQVFVRGGFSTVQGEACPGGARLNADGSLDRSFQPAKNPLLPLSSQESSSITGAVPVRDGKVLVSGPFLASTSPVQYVSLARLERDGALDTTFHTPSVYFSQWPSSPTTLAGLLAAPDGSLVILSSTADFIDDHPFREVGRVLENGHADTSFNLAADFIDATVAGYPHHVEQVQAALPLADGKLLVAGRVTPTSPSPPFRCLLARLNPDGSLDPGFAMVGFGRPPSPGASGIPIPALFLQRDGKIIVESGYPLVNGAARPFGVLVRINPDGTVEETFDPNLDQPVTALVEQMDGKLVISGRFRTVNGVSRRGLARLNVDGSLDLTFDPGTGPGTGVDLSDDYFAVFCLALQPDGRVLAGGQFPGYDGFPVNNLVRLFGGDHVIPMAPRFLPIVAAGPAGGPFRLQVGTGRGQTVVIEASPNLAQGSWVSLTTNQAASDTLQWSDPQTGASRRFYRAVSP